MLNVEEFFITSEQLEKIPEYRRKWQKVALKKAEIDRDRAKLAIDKAYSFLNILEPNIVFFSSPYDAFIYISNEVERNWGKLNNSSLGTPIAFNLLEKLLLDTRKEIKPEVLAELGGKLDVDRAASICSQIYERIEQPKLNNLIFANSISFMDNSFKASKADELSKNISKFIFDFSATYSFIFNKYSFSFVWEIYLQFAEFLYPGESHRLKNFISSEIAISLFTGKFNEKETIEYRLPTIELSAAVGNVIIPSLTADFAYYIDFYNRVFNCTVDSNKWEIFKDLITNCGWIFPYHKTVLVCDR